MSDNSANQIIQFSNNIKNLLKSMMGATIKPISIKGTKSQLDVLTRTLLHEKKFLESFQKYGSEHPRTQRDKSVLDQNIEEFEQLMGIEWPLRE